jgi:hypothetical protein
MSKRTTAKPPVTSTESQVDTEPRTLEVWIAYREDDAVYQEKSILGVFCSEAEAQEAANDEARSARDDEDKQLYYDPDDGTCGEADWDVNTGVEGPFVLQLQHKKDKRA